LLFQQAIVKWQAEINAGFKLDRDTGKTKLSNKFIFLFLCGCCSVCSKDTPTVLAQHLTMNQHSKPRI